MINIKIVDNFLNAEDFNELCTLSVKLVKDDSMDVYNNYIHRRGMLFDGEGIQESRTRNGASCTCTRYTVHHYL